MKDKLTPKQARFVQQYLVDLNATAAAERAGYSKRTAKSIGHDLLKNEKVSEAIAKAMGKRAERTGITADRVLQELARIAFFDPRSLLNPDGTSRPVNELDDDTAAALAGMEVTEEFDGKGKSRKSLGFTKKVKVADKVQALGLAMRHLGMLNDKLHIPGGLTVVVKDYTGRKRDE
jgi:phage terminase small subunit